MKCQVSFLSPGRGLLGEDWPAALSISGCEANQREQHCDSHRVTPEICALTLNLLRVRLALDGR